VTEFETPFALLTRLKLWREETCQRLLTTLILDGPYPRCNTRSQPGRAGLVFLHGLYDLAFAGQWPGDDLIFVDEFELPPPTDEDRGGAPDYAVIWPDRLWLIELKTERGSHQATQIPMYYDLGRHHYPLLNLDLLYLTQPMDAPYAPADSRDRYAHIAWPDILPLLRVAWPDPNAPGQREVLDGLIGAIGTLHLKPAEWRATVTGVAVTAPPPKPMAVPMPSAEISEQTDAPRLDEAMRLVALTSEDGKQRAMAGVDLDGLLELRLALRHTLAASVEGSPLRLVLPWMWRWESGGPPLTTIGAETGRELRLSRYRTPRY
jgi:hypothetical protein